MRADAALVMMVLDASLASLGLLVISVVASNAHVHVVVNKALSLEEVLSSFVFGLVLCVDALFELLDQAQNLYSNW